MNRNCTFWKVYEMQFLIMFKYYHTIMPNYCEYVLSIQCSNQFMLHQNDFPVYNAQLDSMCWAVCELN